MLQLIVILIIFSNANKIKHILGNRVSYQNVLDFAVDRFHNRMVIRNGMTVKGLCPLCKLQMSLTI